jgi:hypothetical protein
MFFSLSQEYDLLSPEISHESEKYTTVQSNYFLMISISMSLVSLSPIIGQPVDGHNISGELIEDIDRDGIVNFPGFAMLIDDWFYMR